MRRKRINIINGVYQTLRELFDPATEGNPYESDRMIRAKEELDSHAIYLVKRSPSNWRIAN